MKQPPHLGSFSIPNAIALLTRATHFAARAHKDQRRKGLNAEPYINHCLEVAELVANACNPGDIEVVVAALLHDTVEDVGVTKADLVREFGPRVAELVISVSDDKSLSKEVRKDLQIEKAKELPRDAKLIKISDTISNLRMLPHGWTRDRQNQYVSWIKTVVEACGPVDEKLDALFTEALAGAAIVQTE